MELNFLGLEPEYRNFEKSKVVILPLPYERTTSYIKGTCRGPEAIISASQMVELYDEELDGEPYRIGISTVSPFEPAAPKAEDVIAEITEHCRTLLKAEKFVVTLGGEHTISIGLVKAHRELHPSLSVLQLDAHADLRDSYEGSQYSHACTMARIREICPYVGVGIRSLSLEEAQIIKKESLKIVYARAMAADKKWITEEVLSNLSDQVYLTVDLDYFDPSIIPSVGTPEPGGLGWYETLSFLKEVMLSKQVIGFDIVELCPHPDLISSDFLAARFIYKLIGYKCGNLTSKSIFKEKRLDCKV